VITIILEKRVRKIMDHIGSILISNPPNGIMGTVLRFKKSTSLWLLASSIAFIALLGLTMVTDDATSYSGGITGRTESGCTCHSATGSGDVRPVMDGLPSSYTPGQVYDLEISFDGGPPQGPGPRAGFNLKVEGGTLIVPSGSNAVRIDGSGSEATHTSTGNSASSWQVQWRAPEDPEGDIEATLVVNVVNGDGSPSSSDKWGRLRVTINGEGGGLDGVLIWALVIVVLIIVGLIIWRSKGGKTYSKNRPRRKGGKRSNRRK
jgi:hypothetical protein